jgi:hypothetical protein
MMRAFAEKIACLPDQLFSASTADILRPVDPLPPRAPIGIVRGDE